MSNGAITNVLNAPLKSSTHRLILLIIANAANEDWEAWLSWSTLVKQTCLSRNTIPKALNKLRQMGALIDTGKRKGPTKSVIVYRLEQYQNWGTLSSTKNDTPTSTKIGTPTEEAVPNLCRSSTKIGIQKPKEPKLKDKRYCEADENPKPLTLVPPVSEPPENPLAITARILIDLLNEMSGKRFEYSPASMNPILKTLKRGKTEIDCRLVIVDLCKQWNGDEQMRKYLRPSTIFNGKFDERLEEIQASRNTTPPPEYTKKREVNPFTGQQYQRWAQ